MSCDRYTVAIVDHACGAEIPADAATHLRTCGACSRLFDEQRRLLQDLDQELQRALAIEPSARFLPDAMAGRGTLGASLAQDHVVDRPGSSSGRARPRHGHRAAIR